MIRFIIRSILILIILILLAPIVFAVDSVTRDKLFNEATSLCGIYSKVCRVMQANDDKYMWGQTNPRDEIRLSSALIRRMNEAQVRGVLFHEVGHVVFNHAGRTIDYVALCGRQCDPIVISEMRKRYELEADRFATYVGIYTHKEVDLIGALLILTPPEHINSNNPTHPSTADRIKEIRRIKDAK